jgi:nicotinamidase-related amidase
MEKPVTDPFEDHCWKDVIPAETIELYSQYKRPIAIKGTLALLAVDLYELVYQGGPLPVAEVSKKYPSSCGEHAWNAIEPTKRLFAAAREAGLPIFYSTDAPANSRPSFMNVTKRKSDAGSDLLTIRADFKPQPGDIMIQKQRASVFFGTPIVAHLNQLGVNTIIMCGESTSGCLRATTVDAYSYGFNVVLAEECCFDRSLISHKVSLFDLHHKYADVMTTDEVVKHLQGQKVRKSA